MRTPMQRHSTPKAYTTVFISMLCVIGCGGPLQTLSSHMDDVTDIYTKHLEKPADGLSPLISYLEANNPSVEQAVSRLRTELQTADDSTQKVSVAQRILTALGPRRERLSIARSTWQKAAVLDPDISERMRDLGSVPVQTIQTTFDAAISGLFRDLKRVAAP